MTEAIIGEGTIGNRRAARFLLTGWGVEARKSVLHEVLIRSGGPANPEEDRNV